MMVLLEPKSRLKFEGWIIKRAKLFVLTVSLFGRNELLKNIVRLLRRQSGVFETFSCPTNDCLRINGPDRIDSTIKIF
jgi:hypothetical protein